MRIVTIAKQTKLSLIVTLLTLVSFNIERLTQTEKIIAEIGRW